MRRDITLSRVAYCVVLAGLMILPMRGWALNILLCNDDGFETASIQALYQQLTKAGDNVLISAPAQNQSARGGAVPLFVPVGPLPKDSRFGTVKAGAPGAGPEHGHPNIYYVNSTPVGACMYGLDVVAHQHWGRAPDLVISGPNYGLNQGRATTLGSGTINAALFAVNRGIPGIATSFADTTTRSFKQLRSGGSEYKAADLIVRLVKALQAGKGSDQRLLPPNVGLNVNIPPLKQMAHLPSFHFSRLGYAKYSAVFYANLADSPAAQNILGSVPAYPGISILVPGTTPPTGVDVPHHHQNPALSEVVVNNKGEVSVTVLEGSTAARRSNEDAVRVRLNSLLSAK